MTNTNRTPTNAISAHGTPIPLSTLPSSTQHPEPENEDARTIFSDQNTTLPAVDGGWPAWRLLLAAFVFEALLWGFPLSFGVFQEYYSHIPAFSDSAYISAIGTTASGISYLGAPLSTPLIRRYSRYRTHMILVGWPLCILGLVAGSFANSLGTLLLTQGVMYGIGFVVFYYPILSMVDEFWIRRRGMAYGFLCSASGASGAVMPLIIQALLRRYGHRTTLRAVAVALVLLTGPLIPLLKGRLGHLQHTNLRTDWSFVRKGLFWTYMTSNVFMGMGYFFPAIYLPSYASQLGLSPTHGALLLTLMSLSQVAGQFSFGYLSDKPRVPLNILIVASASIAALVTLSLWGLARSLASLAVFAVIYGFFGAAYTAMWARMVTAISEEPSASQALFGLFCAGKGVGNILTGPISGELVRMSFSSAGYGLGVYQAVVIFTGACLVLSAGSLAGVWIGPK
ncbi:major facilitator superfamily domain-containing protein [Ampelomyces quisqualis]|uniref:Major facilitator superfamily domain-containing protein n=1 Tax=Ampelomyces quisqualis TaxID=50730 RepID=A0A6A5QRW7_AMPQU|nr:major facilitator superfamily domain-containing protein [Ampelomyces quisqualis]